MPLIIREATPADASALAHVIVTATRHTFTGLVPDVYLTWLSADEQAACRAQATAAGRDLTEALVQAEKDKSATNWRKSFADKGIRMRFCWSPSKMAKSWVTPLPGQPPPTRYIVANCAPFTFTVPPRSRNWPSSVQAVAQRLAIQGIHSLRVGVLRVNPSRQFYARLGGQYLYDRDYEEGGFVQPECVYGWQDTQTLLEITPT